MPGAAGESGKVCVVKKLLVWLALPVAVGLVAVGVWLAAGPLKLSALFGARSESSNTQVIAAVTREQQVVLVSLGIQGIDKKSGTSTFMGVDIPGSERATFLKYSFSAKLGLEGKDVKVAQSAPHSYRVSIPRFIFIGHANENFETVVETDGVLSFATPEIDTAAMVTSILNDEAQAQYIRKNADLLRDQANVFYSTLIAGVDPEATVAFEYAD